MALMRKTEPQLWNDESDEPASFTPEEVNARLEAANDRMEQENQASATRLREMNELLSRQEVRVASLECTLRKAITAAAL